MKKMKTKIFERIFIKETEKIEDESFDNYGITDYELKRELEIKVRNYKMFENIVGETPMEQIDYIIKNGLSKFHYWYRCYETGSIYTPATVKQAPKEGSMMTYVCGGRGNAKLVGWSYGNGD